MLHICQDSFKQKLVCLFRRSIFLPNKRRSVHLVKKFSSVAKDAVSLHYPALPFVPTARENVCLGIETMGICWQQRDAPRKAI